MEHQDFVKLTRDGIKASQRVKSVATKVDGILVNFKKCDGHYEANLFSVEPNVDDGDIIQFKSLMQDDNIVITPSKKKFLIWSKA